MKITVIGTGYVGLVAGACFAHSGNEVTCVDLDEDRIRDLEHGQIPFYEPGLGDIVRLNVSQKRLAFTTDGASAAASAQIIFIAVGTPQSDSGAADLSAVFAVARTIGRNLRNRNTDVPTLIVIKSTVPVGTTDRVRNLISQETDARFSVVFNPEFLKEGDAVNDFMRPARVILGGEDEAALGALRNLYEPFVRTNNRIQLMDTRSAELTKYAANCMLATRVSYMNQMALLAEQMGADIEQVRRGMGADPRIGPSFLFAGPGFGGSCFPKDLQALIHMGNEANLDLGIIRAVQEANEWQKQVLAHRVREHYGDLRGRRVTVWGLAFKPETDDIREAPALTLIDYLLDHGAEVHAYDPAAADGVRARYGDRIHLAQDMYSAAQGSDAVALVTEWHMFRRPDFDKLQQLMRTPALFDGRNMWHGPALRKRGFVYYGIGREVPPAAHLAEQTTLR